MDHNNLNAAICVTLTRKEKLPYWVVLINDLVEGAGYSYSRIAYRIDVSPSTIQKLATNHKRTPRHVVFHRLLVLYYKVFYGPYAAPQAVMYIKQREFTGREKALEEMMVRQREMNKIRSLT